MFSPCRKYREDLCVAVNSDLPASNRAALERHLQACPGCKQYRDELGKLTAQLTAGGELFPDIEPREATRIRWAKEFEKAVTPIQPTSRQAFRVFLDWSKELVWPCRRIWAGMAAIWIVILGLNAGQWAKEEAQASARPSPEFMRALLACEGFLPGARIGEDRERPKATSHPLQSEPKHESKTS